MQPGDHTPNYTSLTDVTNFDIYGYAMREQRLA